MNTDDDLLSRREETIKKRDEFFTSCMINDPEFAEAVGYINSFNKSSFSNSIDDHKPTSTKKRKRSSTDYSWSSPRHIGIYDYEPRKSDRLKKMSSREIDPDWIVENENNIEDIENVGIRVQKRKKSYTPKMKQNIIAVEDVTEEMLANIAMKVSIKKYSDRGTSCHQCRQKTLDTKTCCRSPKCFGVRGQFCGVCALNRYGEYVAVALKDPNWECFVCRDVCNCSFCRTKMGKRPTGILTPLALERGYNSVKEFLDSLNGEGDYAEKDSEILEYQDLRTQIAIEAKNPENLLGFVGENQVVMGGNVIETLQKF